jgi:hypothetical protein
MAKAASVGTLSRKCQARVQLNHDKVLTAPTVLSEVLDQVYEVLQTAAHVKDLTGEMGMLLEAIGARAKADNILQPRELIERYWPLTNRVSCSK